MYPFLLYEYLYYRYTEVRLIVHKLSLAKYILNNKIAYLAAALTTPSFGTDVFFLNASIFSFVLRSVGQTPSH